MRRPCLLLKVFMEIAPQLAETILSISNIYEVRFFLRFSIANILRFHIKNILLNFRRFVSTVNILKDFVNMQIPIPAIVYQFLFQFSLSLTLLRFFSYNHTAVCRHFEGVTLMMSPYLAINFNNNFVFDLIVSCLLTLHLLVLLLLLLLLLD